MRSSNRFQLPAIFQQFQSLLKPVDVNTARFNISLNDMALYKVFDWALGAFGLAMKTFQKPGPVD